MPSLAQQPTGADSLAQEVRQLRQLVETQQQQIQQLREEMARRDEALQQLQSRLLPAGAAPESPVSLEQVARDVADIQSTLANTAVNTQEEQKRVSEIEKTLGRFRWKGDVRVRGESFNQAGAAARYRGRVRLRLGVESRLNEDFSAGIYVASGSNEAGFAGFLDPVSTNQTLTDFFERKTIGIDRGWITFHPRGFKPLILTGGKFAFTWKRTPLTFDSDLNPEGFSEQLSFDLKNPVARNVTFTAMQLLFRESGSGVDSYATGGQISSRLQLGERVTLTPSATFLKWNNEDSIVAAAQAGSLGGSLSKTRLQNALNGAGTGYLSGFFYSDYIVETGVKTPWQRWPLKVTLEYLDNLDAATSQGQAFFGEAALGDNKDQNDFQFGYGFARVEQDAVLAAFNESDWRAQTNLSQHSLFLSWMPRKNAQLKYTLWLGRFLDPALAGLSGKEDRLKRGQLDLVYSF
jgi:hypothetical protein